MFRAKLIILLTLFFALPTFSQESILPFGYVINGSEVNQNAVMMDALSGEILYEFYEEYTCPISISEDGVWFVYSQQFTNNYLMEIATGEVQELWEGPLGYVAWSSRYNLAAYHYNFYGVNQILVYGTTREELFYQLRLAPANVSASVLRFVGSELVAVALERDTNELEVQSVAASRQEAYDFELKGGLEWRDFSISPNGQFLLAFGPNGESYRINLNTGSTIELGTSEFSSLSWLPNREASLVYIVKDTNGNAQLELLEPEHNQDVHTLYPMSISPDARYVIYKTVDAENPTLGTLWLLDTENAEQVEIGFTSIYTKQVQWLSPSQFVYLYQNPESEARSVEIYFYDAATQEGQQLTATPELEESFDCARGAG